jgi:ArsR family metal-binding transcriptional regulator
MTEHIPFKPVYEGTLGYARKQWIVKWKSRITGLAGQGCIKMTKQEAQELADEMNEKLPEIEHWIEKAE